MGECTEHERGRVVVALCPGEVVERRLNIGALKRGEKRGVNVAGWAVERAAALQADPGLMPGDRPAVNLE